MGQLSPFSKTWDGITFRTGFTIIQTLDIKKDAVSTITFVTIRSVCPNIFAMLTQCQRYQIAQVVS